MSDRCQAQQVRVWGSPCRGDSQWVGGSGSIGSHGLQMKVFWEE